MPHQEMARYTVRSYGRALQGSIGPAAVLKVSISKPPLLLGIGLEKNTYTERTRPGPKERTGARMAKKRTIYYINSLNISMLFHEILHIIDKYLPKEYSYR